MRNLADKAIELSKKHNLKDEVKMIQEEENCLKRTGLKMRESGRLLNWQS